MAHEKDALLIPLDVVGQMIADITRKLVQADREDIVHAMLESANGLTSPEALARKAKELGKPKEQIKAEADTIQTWAISWALKIAVKPLPELAFVTHGLAKAVGAIHKAHLEGTCPECQPPPKEKIH